MKITHVLITLLFITNTAIHRQDNCGFHYKKNITINGSRVSGGPHINFPVLISHTDTDLSAASGKVTDAQGDDIIFTDNSGNLLDFQRESYNSATGQYVAWVKIPVLTAGTNVIIQMLYGKASITTNQSTTSTWSSGYEGVWHLSNSVSDNSDKNISSTNNGSTDASGKIGSGRNFNRPNHWIELNNHPNKTTNFTISGWINTSNNTLGGQRIFADDRNNNGGYALSLADPGAGSLRFFSRGSNPVSLDSPNNLILNNTWYHVAAVADITNGIKRIYINGVQVASGAFTNTWGTDVGNASIGGEVTGAESGSRFTGRLDEIRVASRALSANWLATEYATQNQPTTSVGTTTSGDFYTVSNEEFFGNPDVFGDNVWNAYCYNVASYNNTNFDFSDYRGFYTQAGTNFSSSDLWNISSNPSTATGYAGCAVTNDLHVVHYKRKGFTCGFYQINIAGTSGESGHDDAAKLIIDGIQQWSNTGCCAARNNVWTGYLGANSEVEFVWSDNGGESYGRVTFIPLDHPTVSPDVTICAGSNTTLTASNASNYDWTLNATHLIAPLNTASVVCSPAGATPNSVETYTVSTTDATTGCTLSNTVDVTIDPLPSTSVTPTTAGPFCGSGSTNAIATGAATYTWSPMIGITVNSASGNDVTINAASTTTYTVTGSNNCATNSAIVTINIDEITGDPSIFGDETWNVYVYDGNNFNTFYGNYEHNTLNFDTRDVWSNNGSPSNAAGYVGCDVPNDQHSFTYKRKGFDCGFYQLDIPNHDDGVNLIIDGVSVFSQNAWFNNTYKANVWQGYLGADTEIEYRISESGGGSNGGLAFIYLNGPENSTNETIWNGSTSANWFIANNWCGDAPSETVSAYIPQNTNNEIEINADNAKTNSIFIQSGVTLTINPSRQLDVYGSWINNGTITPSRGSINFKGNNPITIGGSSISSFNDLVINNSNSNAITLAQNIQITGSITFTNGHIYTGANRVIFQDNATSTGASDSSHISGIVRKVGNDAFTFPIGKNSLYAPVSITAPSDVAHYFEAEYFDTDPDASFDNSSKASSIDHISTREYWNITRNTGPTSDVSVSLSWNTERSGVVQTPSELLLVHWNGTQWENLGNGGTSGTNGSGTITSAAVVADFSPFTIGSGTPNNPLPIELGAFNVVLDNNTVKLSWTTISETNNDYFIIERSKNGESWEQLRLVKGAGTSGQLLNYREIDKTPLDGISYYRLKQVDFDGQYSFSQIKAVDSKNFQATQLSLYPNPISGDVVVLKSERDIINGVITVFSIDGGVIYQDSNLYGKEVELFIPNLGQGTYILEIKEPIAVSKVKLVKY